MTARAPAPSSSPRQRFARRRARAATSAATVLVALAGPAILLGAPGDLGAIRWSGVGLGWWVAFGALVLQVVALAIGAARDR